MIVKPAVSFLNRDCDADLRVHVSIIIFKMTGNPDYPNPTPTLAEVDTALNVFIAALMAAADGGKALTAAKNAARKALVRVVRALANHVQSACDGDYSVLLGSGFPTHKPTRSPIGYLSKPAKLAVKLGMHTGELDASVAPVPGAVLYGWRVTTAAQPGVVVLTRQTTAADITLPGLTPGVIYLVEANCIGTAGPSDWTGPISKMVV
jgi:hypothetical protein